MPVDLYVGGQEHAVLHLLYARFWHKVCIESSLEPVMLSFSLSLLGTSLRRTLFSELFAGHASCLYQLPFDVVRG